MISRADLDALIAARDLAIETATKTPNDAAGAAHAVDLVVLVAAATEAHGRNEMQAHALDIEAAGLAQRTTPDEIERRRALGLNDDGTSKA